MTDSGRGVEEIYARRFDASTVAEYALWKNEKRLWLPCIRQNYCRGGYTILLEKKSLVLFIFFYLVDPTTIENDICPTMPWHPLLGPPGYWQ